MLIEARPLLTRYGRNNQIEAKSSNPTGTRGMMTLGKAGEEGGGEED